MGVGIMPRKGRAEAGFSLIELLVVVSIMSVLSVAAVLSFGRRNAPALDDAALLVATYDTQRSLAIHSNTARGIMVTKKGLRVATKGAGGWQIQTGERALAGTLRVYPDGPSPRFGEPQIVVLPNGQSTAFTASARADGVTVRCQSDGWTGLLCSGQ